MKKGSSIGSASPFYIIVVKYFDMHKVKKSPRFSVAENAMNRTSLVSVLDNTETLVVFSTTNKSSSQQKNSFLSVYYRWRNIRLGRALEASFVYQDHSLDYDSKEYQDLNKTIRNLMWCSSASVIEKNENGIGTILKKSKTCKNPHCSLCQRNRSGKLVNRFDAALKDPDNKNIFHDKRFYFLTLTVKHDAVTRNYVYVDEFKSYCKRLFNCKAYNQLFPKKQSGRMQAVECTIGQNGYHIHAHVLICAPRLKQKVQYAEKTIRAKWLKLTKDSTGVRLDLLNIKSTDENIDFSAIQEVFKYSVKTGNMKDFDEAKANLYCNWILGTKGKNFVNASGLFRGLQLTGAKSRYDVKGKDEPLDSKSEFYMGKTIDLKFNRSPKRDYSKKKRRDILGEVSLVAAFDFLEITDVAIEMMEYLQAGTADAKLMAQWLELERSAKAEREDYVRLLNEAKAKDKAFADLLESQLSMFEKTEEAKAAFNSEGW